jgi:hypothetical protein
MEALEGEHDPEPARLAGRSFESKSLPVRAIVIAAGVIMNALFAWFLYTLIAMAWGVGVVPGPVVGDVAEERCRPKPRRCSTSPWARGSRPSMASRLATSQTSSGSWPWRGTHPAGVRERAPVVVPVPRGDTERADLVRSVEPRLPIPALVEQVEEGHRPRRLGCGSGIAWSPSTGSRWPTGRNWSRRWSGVRARRCDLRTGPGETGPDGHARDPRGGRGRLPRGAGRDRASRDPRERLGPVAAARGVAGRRCASHA